MSQPTVHVEFPSEMTVHSPKTDQQLDAMMGSFTTLIRFLQNNFEVLLRHTNAIEQLPTLIKEFERVVHEQFELALAQQFEVKVATHQAEIMADESRLQAVRGSLEQVKLALQEGSQKIQQRYEKLLNQIAEDNLNRRQDLDGHAYELLQATFPDRVQKKFSQISLPAYYYLAAHTQDCYQARTEGLLEAFKAAFQSIEHFLARHQQEVEHLKQLAQAENSGFAAGTYRLRGWFAEVENLETGEKKLEIRFEPSEANLSSELKDRLLHRIQHMTSSTERENLKEEMQNQLAEQLAATHLVPADEIARFRRDCQHWVGAKELTGHE